MEYPLTFEQYQEGLRNGKVLGLKCRKCGAFTFPAQGTCSGCGTADLEVTPMKGKGTVRSFTVVRVAPEGMKPPYIVAMVELDEGPWITGNVVGLSPEEADMGLMGKKVSLGSREAQGGEEPEAPVHVLTFALI